MCNCVKRNKTFMWAAQAAVKGDARSISSVRGRGCCFLVMVQMGFVPENVGEKPSSHGFSMVDNSCLMTCHFWGIRVVGHTIANQIPPSDRRFSLCLVLPWRVLSGAIGGKFWSRCCPFFASWRINQSKYVQMVSDTIGNYETLQTNGIIG